MTVGRVLPPATTASVTPVQSPMATPFQRSTPSLTTGTHLLGCNRTFAGGKRQEFQSRPEHDRAASLFFGDRPAHRSTRDHFSPTLTCSCTSRYAALLRLTATPMASTRSINPR